MQPVGDRSGSDGHLCHRHPEQADRQRQLRPPWTAAETAAVPVPAVPAVLGEEDVARSS